MMPDLIQTAEEAWGTPLPDWVRALAIQCQRTSQNDVARQLGRSASSPWAVMRASCR
jgi:hypothetical protein